jgi:hypothetical protein
MKLVTSQQPPGPVPVQCTQQQQQQERQCQDTAAATAEAAAEAEVSRSLKMTTPSITAANAEHVGCQTTPRDCQALTRLSRAASAAVLKCAWLVVLSGAGCLPVMRPLGLAGAVADDVRPAAAPAAEGVAHLPVSTARNSKEGEKLRHAGHRADKLFGPGVVLCLAQLPRVLRIFWPSILSCPSCQGSFAVPCAAAGTRTSKAARGMLDIL